VGRSELQLAGNGLKNGKSAEAGDATELFSRYSVGVYRYCLGRLGSPEEAEDALQVTYLNAWRSLKRGFEPQQVRRFSRLAGYGLAVVVVAGVLRSTNELGWGWWLHPFQSDYSTTLVVKLAIVVPLIGLGALNRYRNVAHLDERGARPVLRTAGAEIALAAAVLATTAVLTGFPPSRTPRPRRPPRSRWS